MTNQALVRKIDKIEKELLELKKPKGILGKLFVDKEILEKAKKAVFDFDIENLVSKKDLKLWK